MRNCVLGVIHKEKDLARGVTDRKVRFWGD